MLVITKNTSSITCRCYATLFKYIISRSYDNREVAQGHVTKGRRSEDPNRALGFGAGPLSSRRAASLCCRRSGRTPDFGHQAKLYREVQALELPVGRAFGLRPYLLPAAVAIFSLIFLPSLSGWAHKTLLRKNALKL